MKQFKSVMVAGTVCLVAWAGSAIATEIQMSDVVFSDVVFSDIGLQDPLAGGGSSGGADSTGVGVEGLAAEGKSWAGKMSKFSINAGGLLSALAGAAVPSTDKTRVAVGFPYLLSNAQAAPALAGGYSPAAIAATAGHVANDGEKMNELLDKLIDDKNRIDPLLVGPSGKQGIVVANDLGGFVKELQKIPDAKMKGNVANKMDAVADGTDDLLASLEKIVPVLAKLGKKINSTVN